MCRRRGSKWQKFYRVTFIYGDEGVNGELEQLLSHIDIALCIAARKRHPTSVASGFHQPQCVCLDTITASFLSYITGSHPGVA
jgi:hypothetical protein